jgi:hypothetical protein
MDNRHDAPGLTGLDRRRLDRGAALAATLDRLADAELQHGHHAAAEHLARQAAAMREAAR